MSAKRSYLVALGDELVARSGERILRELVLVRQLGSLVEVPRMMAEDLSLARYVPRVKRGQKLSKKRRRAIMRSDAQPDGAAAPRTMKKWKPVLDRITSQACPPGRLWGGGAA